VTDPAVTDPAVTDPAVTDPAVTGGDAGSPNLVLGPMLRFVSETEATIWVETDRACQVEILGRQAASFEVAGHHYGLVVIDGLEPGSEHEYQVALDGTLRWPAPDGDFPPSLLRTLRPAGSGRTVKLAFGSCRVTQLPAEAARDGVTDVDALAACAAGLRDTPRDRWPDALLLIGDQVYADNPGPATRRLIRQRRDPAVAPGEEAVDFEEYRALYQEAWTDPAVRWLLSVLPTAMIFDDHDVHDDWNTSASWREEFRARPWWRSRIEGAYLSYWIYQHLGNLSPAELATDEVWQKVRQPGDAAPVLRDIAHLADERAAGIRWSFSRTFGKVRVVMIDSRSRRVVDGQRMMADEAEWQWVIDSVRGDWEHVVLATSVPLLLPRGIHALEAWSEIICAGAWGSRLARFGERLRRAVDLEHWPSFGRSFALFEELLIGLATGLYGASGADGEQGQPPASVTVISGDVHHSYLTAVDLPAGVRSRTAVYQAVCSPIHQWMPPQLRRAQRLGGSAPGGLVGSVVARLAGAHAPAIRWRITQGPWFENMLSVLEFDDDQARVRFDRATTDASGHPRLATAYETRLS
jgi:PhoD-like phosphatase